MNFSFCEQTSDDSFTWFKEGFRAVLQAEGHVWVEDPNQASLVLNFVDSAEPEPFRSGDKTVYVAAVTVVDAPFGGPMEKGYPIMVRSLSKLLIGLVDEGHAHHSAHFVTPEQGHYVVEGSLGTRRFFVGIYERLRPLITSRPVLENLLHTDLETGLWGGDGVTRSLHRAGQRLADLDLLPAPFPMDEYLSERDRRHMKSLYGIGGMSFGNLSARLDETRFWMSASGVDKSNLREVGRDILLVKGYDPERDAMLLSVPANVEPRRVSVDAIEHWMIYQEHPEVGAILHVHAWMDGVPSTEVNYPCGTYELGVAVADLVRSSPLPQKAVVGLKNHGLTILGESMEEILSRVEGRIYQPVPMS